MEKGQNVSKVQQMVHIWCKPPPGWVKINIDAACKPSDQFVKIGCISRDDSGAFLCARNGVIHRQA